MQSKPTTVLLAVIAVLLAVNFVVNLPPQEATAQPSLRAAAVPHVIQVEPGLVNASVYRLWSDGVIEEAVFDGHGDTSCVPTGTPGFWLAGDRRDGAAASGPHHKNLRVFATSTAAAERRRG